MAFTNYQTKAIEHETGNAIVSASAGSGKTTVVINRIIRLITEQGASVNNILALFDNYCLNSYSYTLIKVKGGKNAGVMIYCFDKDTLGSRNCGSTWYRTHKRCCCIYYFVSFKYDLHIFSFLILLARKSK